MTVNADKFCLRWNDFESNISVAFRELREDKDFFDVTLACDDDKQVQAHKVILAACSPFFQRVLRRNGHPHPLLYLRGVEHSELSAILNFMYHGEVNVAQEQLNKFLTAAEDLKVKGLTQSKTDSMPSSVGSRKSSSNETNKAKRPRITSTDNHDIKNTVEDKNENNNDAGDVQTVDFPSVKSEPLGQGEGTERSQKGELEEYIGSSDYAESSFGPDSAYGSGFGDGYQAYKWRGMGGAQEWDLGAARGLHNPENNIPCLQCGKTFKTRGSLATHKYNFHSNKDHHFHGSKEGPRLPGGDFNFAKQVELFNQQIVSQHVGEAELREYMRSEVSRDVQCPICGKYFSTRGSLATHKYNYHKDRNQNQGDIMRGDEMTNLAITEVTSASQVGEGQAGQLEETFSGGQTNDNEQPPPMESLEGLDKMVNQG